MISYDHNDNIMTFATDDGTERLRITLNWFGWYRYPNAPRAYSRNPTENQVVEYKC